MFSPIKKLGQNFLTDREFVQQMVGALHVLPDSDTIVEIGPGHGVLTHELAEQIAGGSSVIYAVELDVRLVAKLERMFMGFANVHIIESDILKWLPTFDPQVPFKLIGSLPYYITSPILHAILASKKLPEVAVFLVQKEVAEKITARSEPSNYWSVLLATFFNVDYLGEVDRKRFVPAPKVDGGVIRLTKKPELPFALAQILRYEQFLHRVFSHQKKMLNKVFSAQELVLFGIDANLRPHQVPAEKWLECFVASQKGLINKPGSPSDS